MHPYILFSSTVVREIFAYKIFHVLKFRVKNFSDIAYLSEKFLTRNFKTCASQIRPPTVNVNQPIMEEFERPCCIRGYHVYQEVWTAAVGGPRFLLLSVVAFAISRLARAIAFDGIDSDKGPLGLGRPSFGLK